ncbi:MAG: serine/threonine-protein phosphatase [Deltaproteobacteria bacterium]|nr:serine/threonine-protein phosphatase [Deltaproteobacteria bacterium]
MILIQRNPREAGDVVSVVDGWNDAEKIASDRPGREAASFVARRFPEFFTPSSERHPACAAQEAAKRLDREFLDRYPAHVAAVGAFAFCSTERTLLVSIGTIDVWTLDGAEWHKPPEIGDYFLPQPQYESGSRTFWGRGELKGDPFYALRTDTVVLPPETSFLIATDGMDDVLTLDEINTIHEDTGAIPGRFFETLVQEVRAGRKQRDDISLLMRWEG